MQPTRDRVPSRDLPVCAGLGLLAGVLAEAADESGLRWAADLGSYPAAWVLTVALLGRAAPTVRAAAARPAAERAAGRGRGHRAGGGAVLADAGTHPVQAVADVAVAVVLAAVLPSDARTRLWAGVLLMPATWLAGRGLGVLAALLGRPLSSRSGSGGGRRPPGPAGAAPAAPAPAARC